MEADRVDDRGLYDLHARENPPGDRYWLVGVAVCHVFRSLGRRRGWRDLNSYNYTAVAIVTTLVS